ncbi:MAG: aminoacyl-tRNA hydrolase [Acidobacteriota bacterium]
MKIVLGLGNPGPGYAAHRHNIGFWCVERLARRLRIRLRKEDRNVHQAVGQVGGVPVVVAKAMTMMNASGRAARCLLDWHGETANGLIVVHDDVDLELGVVKVKDGGGHGGHNGLRSIIDSLGSRDFARVRIGVGRPESCRVDLADWVLSGFEASERDEAERMAEWAVDAAEAIVTEGVRGAMSCFNRAPGNEPVGRKPGAESKTQSSQRVRKDR